jgi:hypothetical protein
VLASNAQKVAILVELWLLNISIGLKSIQFIATMYPSKNQIETHINESDNKINLTTAVEISVHAM